MDNLAKKMDNQTEPHSEIANIFLNENNLPDHAYNNSKSLNQALTRIAPQQQMTTLTKAEISPAELAHKIATAITRLNIDYAAKLELIHTAINHPTFKVAITTRLWRWLMRSPLAQSHHNAQAILQDAKQELVKSRDKIILC